MIAEIISVGNELLDGRTLNTNAHWLAARLASFGCTVRRITTIGDDLNEIKFAVREALKRGCDWLIISGGLGPTFDDKTLEGVALALRKKLEVNSDAYKMVREKYQRMVNEGRLEKVEMTPPRVKMATLPRGSKALPNPVGTAPGVMISKDKTTIFCLPGVPSEMKAIFTQSIEPLIQKQRKLFRCVKTIKVVGVMESRFAPSISNVMRKAKGTYIKSNPRGREDNGTPRLEVNVISEAKSISKAESNVKKVLNMLKKEVKRLGGKVVEEE